MMIIIFQSFKIIFNHFQDTKEDVKLPYSQRMARVEANKKEGTDLFKDKNYTNAARFYVGMIFNNDDNNDNNQNQLIN